VILVGTIITIALSLGFLYGQKLLGVMKWVAHQDDLDAYKLRLGDYRIQEHDLQYTLRHLGWCCSYRHQYGSDCKRDNLGAERRKSDVNSKD